MSDRYAVGVEAGQQVLVDASSRASAAISHELGNNVTHFRVQPEGRDVPLDVLIPPQEAGGVGPGGYAAGNPILFPFPNRVRGGEYTFEGNAYQLDVNETARGNHIHGLVSRLPWQVEGTGAGPEEGAWHRAVIDLSQFAEAMRQYPFPCQVRVITRLKDGVLAQETTVTNTGQGALPMGYGTHPWFPARIDGGARELTEVRVPASGYWELENLVPSGRVMPVDGSRQFDLRDWQPLNGHSYDDVFTGVLRRADGWIEAGMWYPNAALGIVMEASPEFREWVLFAPTNREVICLEPYTGTTNAVNLHAEGVDAGLVVLPPGESWTSEIRISVRTGGRP